MTAVWWHKYIGAALLLLASSPLQAATLRIKFSLPINDNADSSCTAPVLLPMGANTDLKGHWRWWPAGGDSLGGAVEDSLAGAPGAQVLRDYTVPSVIYSIRAWATDLGGKGCDTLVTALPFKYRPWKPQLLQ